MIGPSCTTGRTAGWSDLTLHHCNYYFKSNDSMCLYEYFFIKHDNEFESSSPCISPELESNRNCNLCIQQLPHYNNSFLYV